MSTAIENTDNDGLNAQGADMGIRIEQVLKDLMVCLNGETLALKEQDQDALSRFQKEKKRLLTRYQNIFDELKSSAHGDAMMDSTVKSYLQKTIGEFESSLRDNAITVRAGQHAITRLITRIMEKARITVARENPNYNASGELVGKKTLSYSAPSRLNETY